MYAEGSEEETKVKTTLVPDQEVVVALPHCAQGIQRCKLYNALPLSTQELAQECSISFELNNSSYLMEKPQHLLWRSMPFKGNHGVESLGFDFEAGSILGKSISGSHFRLRIISSATTFGFMLHGQETKHRKGYKIGRNTGEALEMLKEEGNEFVGVYGSLHSTFIGVDGEPSYENAQNGCDVEWFHENARKDQKVNDAIWFTYKRRIYVQMVNALKHFSAECSGDDYTYNAAECSAYLLNLASSTSESESESVGHDLIAALQWHQGKQNRKTTLKGKRQQDMNLSEITWHAWTHRAILLGADKNNIDQCIMTAPNVDLPPGHIVYSNERNIGNITMESSFTKMNTSSIDTENESSVWFHDDVDLEEFPALHNLKEGDMVELWVCGLVGEQWAPVMMNVKSLSLDIVAAAAAEDVVLQDTTQQECGEPKEQKRTCSSSSEKKHVIDKNDHFLKVIPCNRPIPQRHQPWFTFCEGGNNDKDHKEHFIVGDKVKIRQQCGLVLSGKISSVNLNGTYNVECETDSCVWSEEEVAGQDIRLGHDYVLYSLDAHYENLPIIVPMDTVAVKVAQHFSSTSTSTRTRNFPPSHDQEQEQKQEQGSPPKRNKKQLEEQKQNQENQDTISMDAVAATMKCFQMIGVDEQNKLLEFYEKEKEHVIPTTIVFKSTMETKGEDLGNEPQQPPETLFVAAARYFPRLFRAFLATYRELANLGDRPWELWSRAIPLAAEESVGWNSTLNCIHALCGGRSSYDGDSDEDERALALEELLTLYHDDDERLRIGGSLRRDGPSRHQDLAFGYRSFPIISEIDKRTGGIMGINFRNRLYQYATDKKKADDKVQDELPQPFLARFEKPTCVFGSTAADPGPTYDGALLLPGVEWVYKAVPGFYMVNVTYGGGVLALPACLDINGICVLDDSTIQRCTRSVMVKVEVGDSREIVLSCNRNNKSQQHAAAPFLRGIRLCSFECELAQPSQTSTPCWWSDINRMKEKLVQEGGTTNAKNLDEIINKSLSRNIARISFLNSLNESYGEFCDPTLYPGHKKGHDTSWCFQFVQIIKQDEDVIEESESFSLFDIQMATHLLVPQPKRMRSCLLDLLHTGASDNGVARTLKNEEVQQPVEGTAFHMALATGRNSLLEILLHFGADPTVSPPNGETILHLAAAGGNVKWVKKLLLDQGTNPQLENAFGQIAADVALSNRHFDVAAMLEHRVLSVTGQQQQHGVVKEHDDRNGHDGHGECKTFEGVVEQNCHKFVRPTSIQQNGLLPLLEGRNAIVEAREGAGKRTLCAMAVLNAIDTSEELYREVYTNSRYIQSIAREQNRGVYGALTKVCLPQAVIMIPSWPDQHWREYEDWCESWNLLFKEVGSVIVEGRYKPLKKTNMSRMCTNRHSCRGLYQHEINATKCIYYWLESCNILVATAMQLKQMLSGTWARKVEFVGNNRFPGEWIDDDTLCHMSSSSGNFKGFQNYIGLSLENVKVVWLTGVNRGLTLGGAVDQVFEQFPLHTQVILSSDCVIKIPPPHLAPHFNRRWLNPQRGQHTALSNDLFSTRKTQVPLLSVDDTFMYNRRLESKKNDCTLLVERALVVNSAMLDLCQSHSLNEADTKLVVSWKTRKSNVHFSQSIEALKIYHMRHGMFPLSLAPSQCGLFFRLLRPTTAEDSGGEHNKSNNDGDGSRENNDDIDDDLAPFLPAERFEGLKTGYKYCCNNAGLALRPKQGEPASWYQHGPNTAAWEGDGLTQGPDPLDRWVFPSGYYHMPKHHRNGTRPERLKTKKQRKDLCTRGLHEIGKFFVKDTEMQSVCENFTLLVLHAKELAEYNKFHLFGCARRGSAADKLELEQLYTDGVMLFQACVESLLAVGTPIRARLSSGRPFALGTIAAIKLNGRYDINFDDGDTRKNTPLNDMTMTTTFQHTFQHPRPDENDFANVVRDIPYEKFKCIELPHSMQAQMKPGDVVDVHFLDPLQQILKDVDQVFFRMTKLDIHISLGDSAKEGMERMKPPPAEILQVHNTDSFRDEVMMGGVEALASALFVPVSWAELLLETFEWKAATAAAAWKRNPKETSRRSGLPYDKLKRWREGGYKKQLLLWPSKTLKKTSSESATSQQQQQQECAICCEEHSSLQNVGCQHSFCRGCWAEFLNHEILVAGQADQKITCPDPTCNLRVPLVVILELASARAYRLRRNMTVTMFQKAPNNREVLRACPGKGCNSLVERFQRRTSAVEPTVGKKIVQLSSVYCSRLHFFCFECGKEAHDPIGCTLWEQWLQRVLQVTGIHPRDRGTSSSDVQTKMSNMWLTKNTKPCPSCKNAVMKVEGCNHMTCACRYEFCWICNRKWSECGGVMNCSANLGNNYQGPRINTDANDIIRKNLQESKYTIELYGSWLEREMSVRLEKELLESGHLEKRSQRLRRAGVQDTTFVVDAVRELLEARIFLQGVTVFELLFFPTANSQGESSTLDLVTMFGGDDNDAEEEKVEEIEAMAPGVLARRYLKHHVAAAAGRGKAAMEIARKEGRRRLINHGNSLQMLASLLRSMTEQLSHIAGRKTFTVTKEEVVRQTQQVNAMRLKSKKCIQTMLKDWHGSSQKISYVRGLTKTLRQLSDGSTDIHDIHPDVGRVLFCALMEDGEGKNGGGGGSVPSLPAASSASTSISFAPFSKGTLGMATSPIPMTEGGGDGVDHARVNTAGETKTTEEAVLDCCPYPRWPVVRIPGDYQTLEEAVAFLSPHRNRWCKKVEKVEKDDRLTTIVLGKGKHTIGSRYLEISFAMNIVGDPDVAKEEILVVGGIFINEEIQGNVHLQHMTICQAKGRGVYGWSSFTMEDVVVEQCLWAGIWANGTGGVGRCTNVEVRLCGRSGVAAYKGGSVTLIGDKTTVHHNCTAFNNPSSYHRLMHKLLMQGKSKYSSGLSYGLELGEWGWSQEVKEYLTSTIQLVYPLTKEIVSTNNVGGGNWGAIHGADIHQIKTIAPLNTSSMKTTVSFRRCYFFFLYLLLF